MSSLSLTSVNLTALVLVLVLGVNSFVVPIVQHSYRAENRVFLGTASAKKDPRLGSRCPIDMTPNANTAGPTLVLALSDCTACTVFRVEQTRRILQPLRCQWVLLVAEGENRSGAGETATIGGLTTIRATDDVRKRLNLYFVPRLYFYGANGSLLYCQEPSESLEESCYRLLEIASGGKHDGR
ncbi:MAG: hypothetical protein AMXMBFR19_09240 [Chthonomonadaceae bacterium]|uniref:Uncharacterized protein n=1 Tax=Candidatus Nitrosymbiomonas proteolyticus TaxID=2608984 RepID=A0A809R9W5_9BACT|nr:hypothetical protein NPRO_19580 [Candidatus Nitrosymbiomonas proteolyticus]